MKITLAKTAGFCMGVQRAVEMALDAAATCPAPIYTYGPLIHNPQVLNLLREKGITVLEEIPDQGSGTVLIRAHGVPPDARGRLEKAGFSVIDATCPRVIKVQAIIRKHASQGYACIIVGDKDHPEVKGLMGFANRRRYVVSGINELDALPDFDQAIVVAQTTQSIGLYEEIKRWIHLYHPHYNVFDTICDSTEHRQTETRDMAQVVDAMIVVGGRNSGNTQRLAEVVRETGKPCYLIETEAELDVAGLARANHIGITAGASTPNWIIKRIYRAIEVLPFREEERAWRRGIYMLQRFLLLTNLYVASGAGCLSYACAALQGIEKPLPYMIISVLYVLSMHILNTQTGMKAVHFNDPDRASFYGNHRGFLTLLALVSGAFGLTIAAGMGMFPFILLLMMTLMGLSYHLKVIPSFIGGSKYRRIRDIPGSKTILIALAWGVVTALFPALDAGKILLSTVLAFVCSTLMVFARTAFFDILDMQGDRIVGRETIPILLGRDKTIVIIQTALVIVFSMLFVYSAFGIIPGLGFALLLCPVYLFLLIAIKKRGYMLPGFRLEFFTETSFILAGILTFFWRLGH